MISLKSMFNASQLEIERRIITELTSMTDLMQSLSAELCNLYNLYRDVRHLSANHECPQINGYSSNEHTPFTRRRRSAIHQSIIIFTRAVLENVNRILLHKCSVYSSL